MNLVILQDFLRVGGTERQSLFLGRFLQNSGHKVKLLVFRPGGHLFTEEQTKGLDIEVLQSFDTHLPLYAPGLKKSLKRIHPEIILCMGRTANCYAGFIQNWFPKIPTVGTIRTGKVIFPLQHWSMGKVQAVLVNSNWWKRRLLERGFSDNQIHVIHNALLLQRKEKERQQLRAEMRSAYGMSEHTRLFLNVATFRPGKRHIDLLKIFRKFSESYPQVDWRLWLVGDGKEYRKCKSWVANNALGTKIRFFHFQSDPFPYYAAADVAVSASREDSLPNFLIEAQAARLPIVAYDCKGVAETFIPNKTGYVLEPGNVSGFVERAHQLATDHTARMAFAAETQPFVESRFSAEPQAIEVERFLNSLIS